jgi:hypothetical protein
MRQIIAPPPGLVSDETTFATPGTYEDGNNVRFWQGKPQVIGGWAEALGSALTGTCRNAHSWTDNSGNANIAFGTHSALQVYKAGALYDITPSGLSAGAIDGVGGPGFGAGAYGGGVYGGGAGTDYWARTWSLSNYGQALMASPRGYGLYLWSNDTAVIASHVTQAPANITCMMVTPERQVLAFGCNEEISTTFNPMCIRGSDIEDYTNWTTLPSNNVFEQILEGGGRIVGARQIGSYIAVWTDTSIHLGQFIGAVGQTYRFDRVADNCGLLGPNAVTVVNQRAYWITPDLQVYGWALGSPPAPIPCRIRNDFVDNFVRTQSEKVVACPVGHFGEVWFFYPDNRDGLENSRYIAVSTADGTWFKGVMARTAAIDAGATQYPLFVDPTSYAYWHENGTSANGGALTWHIKTSDQYLGKAETFSLVRGLWPDFEAQTGTVNMEVYFRDYPQATIRTVGPYTLATNVSKKDFMAQGRIGAVKFYGSSAPAFMRFGAPSFDIVATGRQ